MVCPSHRDRIRSKASSRNGSFPAEALWRERDLAAGITTWLWLCSLGLSLHLPKRTHAQRGLGICVWYYCLIHLLPFGGTRMVLPTLASFPLF